MDAKIATTLVLAALLSSCAVPRSAPQQYYITPVFDVTTARAMLQPGTNQIKGSALMRQQGGGVVTCAGRPVYLIPATEYAKDRLRLLYQSGDDRRFTRARSVEFFPNPPEYLETTRQALCDAQGYFNFDKVADGEFFVNSSISWTVAHIEQGGYLLYRVKVGGGEVLSIVLAQ